ncbi:MAG TPA: hypothetical protein VFQ72_03530 [Candidatus Paceibacterota bacterium]|nr:hypothetical protein [Candidatus Paceibacterota bacterium]
MQRFQTTGSFVLSKAPGKGDSDLLLLSLSFPVGVENGKLLRKMGKLENLCLVKIEEDEGNVSVGIGFSDRGKRKPRTGRSPKRP